LWTQVLAKGKPFLFLINTAVFFIDKSALVSDRGQKNYTLKGKVYSQEYKTLKHTSFLQLICIFWDMLNLFLTFFFLKVKYEVTFYWIFSCCNSILVYTYFQTHLIAVMVTKRMCRAVNTTIGILFNEYNWTVSDQWDM
jgi:hypothetical protein